ncbi:GGDEF domain-containing protein [Desulfovibrio mangrovi]|uniref:GGDEF domain-containing protein n=1 Tax=Desulfovibrio mangrovi TaxID=2976983 RepID=UPI002246220C|nr:GGDEF domain-containing protein [Desulfovibrio mangrovi]UZP65951.1 GGDEF domain-containing protein [Desulfovibrio mangrovi]
MQENFYKEVLDSMADGVYFVDKDRRITYWNKGAERISGYRSDEVVGKSCAENLLLHIDDMGIQLCRTGCPLNGATRRGQSCEMSVYMHHKHGHRILVSVRAYPMCDRNGSIIGAVEVFSPQTRGDDVLKELEELRKEVLRDPLTGIGNRRYADITLKTFEAIQRADKVRYCVLMVDIDHFKEVNDTWGHHIGDEILKMVAQSLAGGLRIFDVACRWGGEEFIVLLPNETNATLFSVAERLRKLIETSWLDHEGSHLRVTASFGGAMAKEDEPAESVVARADCLLYRSKQSGRNCVHIETEDYGDSAED